MPILPAKRPVSAGGGVAAGQRYRRDAVLDRFRTVHRCDAAGRAPASALGGWLADRRSDGGLVGRACRRHRARHAQAQATADPMSAMADRWIESQRHSSWRLSLSWWSAGAIG